MTYKLDVKDKKILYELDLNARIPTTKLSKKVSLSQPACYYRLSNMMKNGVIKFFLTNIDYGFFGYFPYRFFCRLQDLSEEKEQNLIGYLKNHEFVPFLASCTGRFDLMFCVMAKNISQLRDILNEIRGKYGKHFAEQQVATVISGEFYPRDYLLEKKIRQNIEKKSFGKQTVKPKLNKEDLIILKELSNNCRATSLDISNKMDLSLDTIIYRVKNLEKNKIINGYTIYLNNEVLGQFRYKIMIQLKGNTPEKEDKILQIAQSFPNVIYSVKTFGAWDLEIDVEVANPEKFIQILREIKNKNSDLIKEYQTTQLTSVHKYNHLPMNVEHI